MADLMGLDATVLETLAVRPMTERALARLLDEPKYAVGASLRRLVTRRLVAPAPREQHHPVIRWQPAGGVR